MDYPRGYGYVLDFSDRTMSEFFEDEFGIEIFSTANGINGTSKRNYLTTFILNADHPTAVKVLRALWDRREGLLDSASGSESAQQARAASQEFQKVIEYIEQSSFPQQTSDIDVFSADRTLDELVADIHRTLSADKPEVAIDHLHTYCMKKFAHLLSVRGESCDKDEPLHSRFGRYRKHLEAEQQLHEFSLRALKSFISLFDSFNDLRNNHSLAHDNKLLEPLEARFIVNSVCAILAMLRALEAGRYGA